MKFHFWLIQNIYCLDILLLFKYTMYNFYKFWERKSVYYLSCIINCFFYSVVYSLGLYCTCPVLYWKLVLNSMPFASHPIWFFNTIFTCTIFSQIVQSNVQLPIITMVEIFSLFEMKIWNLTSLINHFLCKIFSVFVLYALLMMNIQVYSVTLILYIHFKGRFSFLLMNIFFRKLLISWKIDLNH